MFVFPPFFNRCVVRVSISPNNNYYDDIVIYLDLIH